MIEIHQFAGRKKMTKFPLYPKFEIEKKKFFLVFFKYLRCLVPAAGFFKFPIDWCTWESFLSTKQVFKTQNTIFILNVERKGTFWFRAYKKFWRGSVTCCNVRNMFFYDTESKKKRLQTNSETPFSLEMSFLAKLPTIYLPFPIFKHLIS